MNTLIYYFGVFIAIAFLLIRFFQIGFSKNKKIKIRRKFFDTYQSKIRSISEKHCKSCDSVLELYDNFCDVCGVDQPLRKNLPIYSIE